ncbi:hypothetical protein [Nocardia sp. NPDC019395]|uniref:hypothetical protein n=1 Tax=Nocardia sp. NPDC019395 TaxID=3154686 RepID=UPI0034050099
MHSEHSEGIQPPPLPSDQAMSTTLRLWSEDEGECCDRATVERCLEGLRALGAPTAQPTAQYEVDRVIARWRATHTGNDTPATRCARPEDRP